MGMDVFSALAEPTRRQIIKLLAERGPLPATEIYDEFSVSRPAISQHLKVLRKAGLVQVEKRAQQRIYHANPTPMRELGEWATQMAQLWNERLDAFEQVLEAEKERLSKLDNTDDSAKE